MKQHWLPLLTIAIVVASTFMVGSTLGAVLQSSASAGPSEFAAPLTHQSFADRADAVIDRLQRESAGILRSKEMLQDAQNLGYELGGESPHEFGGYVRTEIQKWGKVVRDAGIKIQ